MRVGDPVARLGTRAAKGTFGVSAVSVSSCVKPSRRFKGDNVPARRQIREVVSVLAEERAEESQALMTMAREHAPRPEVADRLRTPVDQSLRVERKVGADDVSGVFEHKPAVRLDGVPGRRHCGLPGRHADATVVVRV